MNFKTTTIEEMRQLLAAGRAPLILDVRTAGEFARVRAKGARSVPLDRLSIDAIDEAFGSRDKNEPIYVICHSGPRSEIACQRLSAAGLTNLIDVPGGTAEWERAGLPVERDARGGVISLERQVRIGAGALVLIGLTLAWTIHPWFLALPTFVGAGLLFSGVTGFCGMAIMLGRMPWNTRSVHSTAAVGSV